MDDGPRCYLILPRNCRLIRLNSTSAFSAAVPPESPDRNGALISSGSAARRAVARSLESRHVAGANRYPSASEAQSRPGLEMSWTCGASGRRNRFLARNWHRQVSALSSPCRKLSAPRPRRFCSPHHFLGTTRMHDNPRNGVVDADCRIHGVPNLFIAGGSVFPTGGCANPTLTIVALALRLAAHLHSELQSAPRIFLNPVPTQGAKTTVTPDGIEGPVSSVEIRNLHGTNPAGPASRTFNAGHNDADRPFATESG